MSQKQNFLSQYGSYKHIDEILKSNPDWKVKRDIAKNPSLSADNITTLLNDPLDVKEVSRKVIDHPNVNVSHITTAMKSRDDVTRIRAVRHPLATREHIEQGLNDTSYQVRYSALDNDKHITTDDLGKAMMDTTSTVRSAATHHPKFTPEQRQRYEKVLYAGGFGHNIAL